MLGLDLLSLLAMLLLAPPSMGLQKCLIHHHGIPHNIASNQGIHFSAKEVWQWAQNHGTHSYYIPHHPEITGPKEWWNEILESQLLFQLGDCTLK